MFNFDYVAMYNLQFDVFEHNTLSPIIDDTGLNDVVVCGGVVCHNT